ncbi:hypothetical protein DY000_02014919 [Brassica cretica]|uniref:Uncharacterized protein n=1 Tax=Brassica cretica TaxID=69181 RepID=A0ABQ7CZA2_BRACR|nr:hypothetical protein DY000_02014919 [Brassica cretica]
MKSSNKGQTVGENTQVLNSSRPQAGHRPLDPRWKEPQFPGSPLEGTPVPRCGVFRVRYMASSTRSNKETQLLFSLDPASLERSIRKEARSSSIDNNTCSSLDFHHPPSTQALVPSTNTRSPPSTKDTHLSSPNILHPTSIDTSVRTSINTEPRDMVATLILVRDERGDMQNQEGHLRNAAGQRIDAQGAAIPELSRASIDDTYGVNCILQCREDYDSRGHGTAIDRQPPAPIDRRAPLTYQVQMPKIDVARLNALRPKPKPSENPPETARIPSDDGADPMEVDRLPARLSSSFELVSFLD